ncbi:MAG TPA: lysophospholipid acyltransferase family protein [Vicinamibacterales bacterium]
MVLPALRTLLTAVVIPLYVLILGPPALVWTLVSRDTRLLFAVGAAGVRLGFALAGLTLRVAGEQHILAGGAVYACNHSSNVEAPAVFLSLKRLFPRVAVLYKAELRRLPVLVWAFDIGGFIPVERANRDQSWPAVERAAKSLQAGTSFFIFPEGTRSRTGELLPFKKGGFVMAIKAQAPIVPVAVSGGLSAMRKGSGVIWPAVITVEFLPAVPTKGRTFEDRDAVIASVRLAIEAGLAKARRSVSSSSEM